MELLDMSVLDLPKRFFRRLFPVTYGRLRDARLQREKALRLRDPALWNNDLYRAIKKIIAESGVIVRRGPFAGMMYWPVGRPGYWAGGTAGSLLGLYELELHGILADIIERGYDRVIDIGCAEGYYAIGLALRIPKARVFAFDIDATARELCKASAFVNNVTNRVIVGGECTLETLRELTSTRCLIVSDCEGSELELLRPDLVPSLAKCDILVELHDVFRPGLSEALLPRFANTHQIDIVHTRQRDPDAFPQLSFLTREERQIVLDEKRPAPMTWAMMRSRIARVDH
jgi:SAM-dependent methyltransferase